MLELSKLIMSGKNSKQIMDDCINYRGYRTKYNSKYMLPDDAESIIYNDEYVAFVKYVNNLENSN